MNAYNIMMYLFLFNISISVVLSLGIYASAPSEPSINQDGTNIANVSELSESTNIDLFSVFGGNILLALASGTVIGGALSIFTGIPGDAAFAYSYFVTFYWSMAKNTVDILNSLASGNDGLLYIVIIFIGILGISFLSFLIQLIRGPWGSMR